MEKKFSSDRLTLARECRGLSKRDVATALNVTPQAYGYYEKGLVEPSPESQENLAQFLGVPITFFSNPATERVLPHEVTFRSRKSMTKAVRDRTLARSSIASAVIAPYLDRFFEWPALAIPDPSDIASPSEAASQLRILWGLGTGPIDNMVHLLEAKGVRVFWFSEESSSVDAFAYWKEDQPFIFLNVAKDSGERSRFDAAHELGHLILHRAVPLDELNDRRESEANEFASSFLLPAEGFGPECPSTGNIKSFLPLKERWGTSAQAMVRRARSLGTLSQWQYDESWRLASMYGWRSGKEPQSLNLERSSLHFKMLDAFKDSGVASEEILSALALPQDIFDELVPEAKAFYRHSFEPLNGWMVV